MVNIAVFHPVKWKLYVYTPHVLLLTKAEPIPGGTSVVQIHFQGADSPIPGHNISLVIFVILDSLI